jgi:hypothetical protein
MKKQLKLWANVMKCAVEIKHASRKTKIDLDDAGFVKFSSV